jgi:pheromone shutdown protein TraB
VRTTITLEPDIAARLHRLASERGTSFKTTVNSTLRAGLDAGNAAAKPYREMTRSLGVQPGVDLTKALRIAAELEDEETVRKIELRK